MKRRRKQRPAPDSGWEDAIPLSQGDIEFARVMAESAREMAEGEEKRHALFRDTFLSPRNDITEEDIARAMDRSKRDAAAEPKAGSAAAWINKLWPNDDWRLLTPKRIFNDIVTAAGNKGHPSESAVREEVNRRLGKPRKRAKRA